MKKLVPESLKNEFLRIKMFMRALVGQAINLSVKPIMRTLVYFCLR
jgi:hypothetical protein